MGRAREVAGVKCVCERGLQLLAKWCQGDDRQTDRHTHKTTKGFPDFTEQDGGPNSLLCSALLCSVVGESEVGGTGAVSIGGRDWWCSGGGGGGGASAGARAFS